MAMKLYRLWLLAGCLALAGWLSASAEEPTDDTAVPNDYRKWTHLKSSLVGPKSKIFDAEGGIHHIYANDKAMEGLKTGKYPEGAALVYDLLEVKEANAITTEGSRRRIDLMVKNREQGKDTGGWVFQRFMCDNWHDDVLKPADRSSCFDCHKKQMQKDSVFSAFRK